MKRSNAVGTPSLRTPPSGLGISTRFTGDGTTIVMSHDESPRVLALNRLRDSFSASAAIVGRELFLRAVDAYAAASIAVVFERFFVSHRYRGVRPEGSGLGLSIVHRLVTAMGGSVDVTSDPGGTTFRVEIPR